MALAALRTVSAHIVESDGRMLLGRSSMVNVVVLATVSGIA